MDNLYNLNVERAILSAVLFDPYSDEMVEVFGLLSAESFSLPFHQRLWIVMEDLIRAEKPVDEAFLKSALTRDRAWDEVAMVEVLASSPVTNTRAYGAELKELAQRREMVTLASMIKKEIIEEDAGAEKLIDTVMRRVEAIAEGGLAQIRRKPMVSLVAKEPDFICKTWMPFPRGTISMVAAPGGTGKTWFVLQLAVRAVKEDPNRKVFLWLSEDDEGIGKSRYEAVLKDVLYGERGDADARIDISTDFPPLLLEARGRAVSLSSKFYTMRRELREYDVIVIDPLLAFYGGDENDNSHARVFMQPFLNWARAESKVIIFLHHSRKGEPGMTSRARGAGAFIDAVRCVYDMDKIYINSSGDKKIDPSSLHLRRFTLTKDNYGAVRHLDGFTVDREIVPKRSAPAVEITYEESKVLDMPMLG